jgi:hypothetical protein
MSLERRTVLYGFSGAGALLALVLFYQIAAPLPDIDPPRVQLKARTQQIAAVVPVSTPPAESFAEIGTRPIFSSIRRSAAAPGTAGAATLQAPEVALVGIMIDSHDRIAMLRTPGSPLASAFHLGATVSGWELSEIAPDRIVLSAGGARDEIRLDANKAPPKSPASPAPPPAAGNSQ